MTSIVEPEFDGEIKAKHRAQWTSGDYPAVAAELIPTLGPELIRAARIRPGDRVLDVAAGSGNAAIPAASSARSSLRATSPQNCLAPGGSSRHSEASTWNGWRPTLRRCRSRTTASTS